MSGLSKYKMLENMRRKHSLALPVYIGDTSGDESSAKSAGIEFIYVSYGFGEPEGSPLRFDNFYESTKFLIDDIKWTKYE